AMPWLLPLTIAYTFAAELSADEALSAGVERVQFSQPLPVYVENFLDFPVGTDVPLGYYDRGRGAWVPAPDGRVLGILGVDADGRAILDVDGDGEADDAGVLEDLGISDDERGQ